MDEKELIKNCVKKDRKSQNLLYAKFAPTLFGVCRRYIKEPNDAEDVLINSFTKIFTKLQQYDSKGSFEGWMKKIAVNEALMFLRKKKIQFSGELNENISESFQNIDALIMEDHLLNMLNRLPAGYRTVFNLFAIEGYKHDEIAKKLNISINTSKSQLLKARKKLKEYLTEFELV